MIHFICGGEWTYPSLDPERTYKMSLEPFFKLVEQKEPEIIRFDDIAHYPMYKPDLTTKRYRNADPKYPGILISGLDNPNNKKYRMIDGRHRLTKMKLDNRTESEFYVFEFHQIRHLLPTQPTLMLARTIEDSHKYLKEYLLQI